METAQQITVIPGSQIGPELTDSVLQCFDAANLPLQFDVVSDFDFMNQTHLERIKKNKFILLGDLGSKGVEHVEHLEFYKYLDLFARVTHIYNMPNVVSRQKDVDIVIFRENLESEYSGVEHEVVEGVFESLKIVTKENSLKIAEYAFQYAFFTGRKKVTAVHKANIMKLADGMFLQATREVAKKYPSIQYEEMIIDNCSMQMVKNPQQFDVMLMPNLYGSIITSIGAGLVGGPGYSPGASVGNQYMLFDQACRTTGKDLIGRDSANPTALIMSACEMLKSMNLPRFSQLICSSVYNIYDEGQFFTKKDDGSRTSQFMKRLVDEITVQKRNM
jgi:isocitrate dehydrogenase (NAD+)